jgi:glycine/D-amino acid oxidase-like deaminating enzyme/nitrite reductase/ring-hydroxylating ferredoxin subunit
MRRVHTARTKNKKTMKILNTIDEKVTSGIHKSYWTDSFQPLIYNTLSNDAQTDVLIVGGGIAGLTTAYCLSKSGRKVILLEDGYLGSGESGRTTAHITYALDDLYSDLENIFGEEKTKLAADSHRQALEWINKTIAEENILCSFKRVDGYLFIDPTDEEKTLDKEYEATQKAGLPTEMVNDVPGFVPDVQTKYIKYPRQGQFHILKYLKGLADAIVAMGGEIYTSSRASEITKEGAKANGFTVKANHIVVATNSPVNDRFTMHTKQFAYRTYVIGAKVPKGTLPYTLWWDTGNMDSTWITKPYHYVRLEPMDDQYDLLIAGGEDHKTGQAGKEDIPEEARYNNLLEWTKKHFPYFEDIEYKWSGQVIEPVDGMAFIGKNPGDENIYIITSDSGNGMTHGTIGGMLLNDIILGNKNPWEDLYSPSRITLSTADDYLIETGNTVKVLVKDWVAGGDVSNADEIKPGDGAILASGLKKIAAYRDEQGVLHTCTAVCPHLGGVLQWNADEKSFDCPLHGSRFTTDGVAINGPSIGDLEKVEL